MEEIEKEKVWRLCTYSPAETFELGYLLGKFAPAGCCLLLSGELGAGKTLFAKGFAYGLGVEEHVTSPTFTVVNQYLSGSLPFVHMDLYRLQSEDEVWERGLEEYFDGSAAVLLEWPEVMRPLLPDERLEISITKHYVDGEPAENELGEWRAWELRPLGAPSAHEWLKEAMKHCDNLSS